MANAGNREQFLGTESEFVSFLNSFNTDEFRQQLASSHNIHINEVKRLTDIYFGEMLHGYRFLETRMPGGKLRILEVGAGLGLISIFLHRRGHEVVALEPAGLGFDFFEATKKEIWKIAGTDTPKLAEKPAEELSPESDGLFDFSFSINVMEHIQDIETATSAILSVLKPDGISVNSCPNYIVPYEPHFAIPIVPFSPAATRWLFSKKISTDTALWDSFNFITWRLVRKMARDGNVDVIFEQALIYNSFIRLGSDEEFMKRHKDGPVGWLYRFLKATKLL
ncbi:MAG: class I SAM-dependent methyltransferase, partial [Pseudomonadota bacterium]